VLIGVGALMLWLSRGYGDSWIEPLIFLLPAAFALATYVFALGRVDGMALKHRENLISNLGRHH
jgi:hypothetical protein